MISRLGTTTRVSVVILTTENSTYQEMRAKAKAKTHAPLWATMHRLWYCCKIMQAA